MLAPHRCNARCRSPRVSGGCQLGAAVAGYACLVPLVEEDDYLFLKTIIPSRKATRDFISKESEAESFSAVPERRVKTPRI